jgi:penicillin-binding protein-related factor A (putative recombinase)
MTNEEYRAYSCSIEPFSEKELASVIKFDSNEAVFIKRVITPAGWEKVLNFSNSAKPSEEIYLKFKSIVKENLILVGNIIRIEVKEAREKGYKINFDPPLGGIY